MKPSIYFISNGYHIKIGKANDVKRRLAELQTGNSEDLVLMYSISLKSQEAAFKLESALHSFYKKYRVKGEWFDITLSSIKEDFLTIVMEDENLIKEVILSSINIHEIDERLNEKELRELYKINLLKAKYLKLLLPIVKKYWDIEQVEGAVKIINVKTLQKLAIKTFNINEDKKVNILLPSFISTNSKLILEEMLPINNIKLKKGEAGRPEEFITYITSDTLLNNLDEEVLKLYEKINITIPEHIKQELLNTLIIDHPYLKLINGKIIEANRILSKTETDLVINTLQTKFEGRTDINSLIDYLYKDIKKLSKRKARTGIEWLEAQNILTMEKIGRTRFYTIKENNG
jgi:hypothetical protein